MFLHLDAQEVMGGCFSLWNHSGRRQAQLRYRVRLAAQGVGSASERAARHPRLACF